jgi:ATP-binding cassette subfamily F protein 3
MSCEKPQLLLLDEPTNHLDIVARDALIEAVNAFPGAVIIVSHDPHVLELTCDRLWLVDGGTMAPYDGDFDDYRALLLARSRGGAPAADAKAKSGASRKEQRRQSARRQETLAPLKRRLAEAEARVDRLGAERGALQAALADPALYQGDPARLVAMQKRLAETEQRLAAAEEAWIARHHELDEAEAELVAGEQE